MLQHNGDLLKPHWHSKGDNSHACFYGRPGVLATEATCMQKSQRSPWFKHTKKHTLWCELDSLPKSPLTPSRISPCDMSPFVTGVQQNNQEHGTAKLTNRYMFIYKATSWQCRRRDYRQCSPEKTSLESCQDAR